MTVYTVSPEDVINMKDMPPSGGVGGGSTSAPAEEVSLPARLLAVLTASSKKVVAFVKRWWKTVLLTALGFAVGAGIGFVLTLGLIITGALLYSIHPFLYWAFVGYIFISAFVATLRFF